MVQNPLPSRYLVLEEVGQGGMAVVYRARDEALDREVAIKVLHPHLLSEPESKARLEREARAVAKLQHDNILQIFDYSGGDSPSSFIVTEFIDGVTLKQFLSNRKVPLPELAALVVMDVGAALQHAHSFGIIHRDVKPENIMVRKDGLLKLMDFGVAQIMDLERMTITGQLLGSPAYMAPELLEGKTVDVRTDIFSLGVMLYQTATGALPFSGRNPHEVLKRIAEGKFADPRTLNPLVADRLARVISRSLARNPADRYPTVTAMLDDLRAYVADAGLADTREELRRFFPDPESYEKDLMPRVVASLVAAGKREQVADRTARALELWSRALAFDPENRVVAGELRLIEGRKRLGRLAAAGFAAMALVGGVWAVLRFAREDVPPSAASLRMSAPVAAPAKRESVVGVKLAETSTPKRPGSPGAASKSRVIVRPPPVASARPSPELRRPAAQAVPSKLASPPPGSSAAAVLTPTSAAALGARGSAAAPSPAGNSQIVRLTLGVHPMNAEVWVDRQKRLNFGPGQDKIDVPWDGPHTLEFRNDSCCLPHTVVVGPGLPRPHEDHLTVRLKPKMAQLTVTLHPAQPGAEIFIKEVTQGKETPRRMRAESGKEMSIPFDVTDELRKSLEVVVFAGDKTVTDVFEIRAGEKKLRPVRLDK